MSKHEDILAYISELAVGTKISVRSVATELNVSDGTAYRAIKDAELMGIVTTIPRVGTVRIEKVEKKNIEQLTYAEVVNIIDGSVLGGKDGLYKTLKKFIIGAMTKDVMVKYISPGNLMIAGNREEVHRLALENECAVLITGGFSCSEDIKKLANEKHLPIISSAYDTFTTATMINKAISENLIKKDIILVEDILDSEAECIRENCTVEHLKMLSRRTKNGKFSVVTNDDKLLGIIDINWIPYGTDESETILPYIVKDPIVISPTTSVAYAAHMMTWESIDFMPVVNNKKYVGSVGRGDIIKALQYIDKQPQVGDTIDDILLKDFTYKITQGGLIFEGKIVPEMLNSLGTASWNALSLIMSTAGTVTLMQKSRINAVVDSFTVFYGKPVQIDTELLMETDIIDIGRSFSKVEIKMTNKNTQELIGKALLSTKHLRK